MSRLDLFFKRMLAGSLTGLLLIFTNPGASQNPGCGDFGFRLEQDTSHRYWVFSIDSSSAAFQKGLRAGQELAAWNQLPIGEAIKCLDLPESISVFAPIHHPMAATNLITRTDGDSTAQIYYINETGNVKGIRISTARCSGAYPDLPSYLAGLDYDPGRTVIEILFDSLLYARPASFSKKEIRKSLKLMDKRGKKISGLLLDVRHLVDPLKPYDNSLVSKTLSKINHQPVVLLVSPLTTGGAEWLVRQAKGAEHIRLIGHTATRGGQDLMPVWPDLMIRPDPEIRVRYELGEDVLKNEAAAHLYRLISDYRRNR